MSTILKALKRLEHDKQAAEAQRRQHDPLAPEIAPSAPPPSARRGPAAWLALAGAAALLGAAASYGVASWWFTRAGTESAADVAAEPPLAAIPTAPRASTPRAAARAARPETPVAGVERVPEPAAPSAGIEAAPQIRGAPPGVQTSAAASPGRLARASAGDPDPWEEAARAAPAPRDEESRAEDTRAAPTAEPPAAAPPVAARPPAPKRVSTPAPRPGETASRSADAPALPSRRPDRAPAADTEGAVAVDSLPLVVLPEEPAATESVSSVASAKAAPPPSPRPSPTPTQEPSAEAQASVDPAESTGAQVETAVVDVAEPDFDIIVLKTVWHPSSDRRSARLRLSNRVDEFEVREDDVVGGYQVQEITPSSVVLAKGDVVITRRVGR